MFTKEVLFVHTIYDFVEELVILQTLDVRLINLADVPLRRMTLLLKG